jgi:hypothetical protein
VRVLKLSQSAALRELQELRANNEAIRCAHLRRDCPRRQPHLRRDWTRPFHTCDGTGLTAATSAPGLGCPRTTVSRGTDIDCAAQ